MRQREMSGGFRGAAFVLGSAVMAFAATSCGGGGGNMPGSPIVSAPTATPTQSGSSSKDAQVRFVITWPTPAASTAARKRQYLSNSTASISITVNSAAPVVVNNPNLSPGKANAGTQTTTVVNVNAPLGDDNFTVDDYDAAAGAGNLLAANTIPYDVIIDQANTVPITLNGNLAKVACAPIAPFVSGTAPTFTLVGPAGQIALMPEDADGNIIVAPGTIPSLTLTATAGAATITATSTTNQYIVNPQVVGAATTLNAGGMNLAGDSIKSTCTITRELAMYVANHSVIAANPSIDIYSLEAPSSSETPTAVIAGTNTQENAIQFPAVDNYGNLYVSNQGPIPGATFGPGSGYIAAYAPAASGNVAPTSLFTGLNRPTGLSVDLNNNLYSTTALTVNVYPPKSAGSTPPTYVLDYSLNYMPLDTNPADCYGNFVDANGLLYLACSNEVLVYAAGLSGEAAATQTIGYLTSEASSSASWIGVAADSTTGTAGSIFAPASNNNLNMIDVYSAGTTGSSAPSSLIAGTFSQPLDIFISPSNPTGGVYVTNFANQSVEIFSSTTLLMTGVASETITIPPGPAGTGTAAPYGVTVE